MTLSELILELREIEEDCDFGPDVEVYGRSDLGGLMPLECPLIVTDDGTEPYVVIE